MIVSQKRKVRKLCIVNCNKIFIFSITVVLFLLFNVNSSCFAKKKKKNCTWGRKMEIIFGISTLKKYKIYQKYSMQPQTDLE